nr:hypothetical protein [Tanacetum cinerariifolium]
MSTPAFAKTHNLIAYLAKPTESEGFKHIIDFLNRSSVSYALTASPTIRTSCIKQFWTTTKVKTINDEVRIQPLIDEKMVNIKGSSIHRTIKLDDAEDGYEKLSEKLTFYKAFFSPQWKFLIHTILQCLSTKTTSWNEFGSTMASTIICLATNQKFNFSRSSVSYALTASPTIRTSCIKQFWTTTKVKTINDEVRIQPLIDEKMVNIKGSFIHRTIKLDDAEGTSCLANAEIFDGLAKMVMRSYLKSSLSTRLSSHPNGSS